MAPTLSSWPRLTAKLCHMGMAWPSRVTGASAPHTATTAGHRLARQGTISRQAGQALDELNPVLARKPVQVNSSYLSR